jgi:hypothetical protein
VISLRGSPESKSNNMITGGVTEGGIPHTGTIQNGPALHWQTHARGSFDHQRLFGALANRITLKCRLASGRRLGMATNGGYGQR